MDKRIEKTKQLHGKGYSCSAAVYTGFADAAGISESEARRIAAQYAGGMKVKCGAVLAAELVLKAHRTDEEGMHLAEEFEKRFMKKNTSVVCREIKSNRYRSCAGCVEDSAVILADMLEEYPL